MKQNENTKYVKLGITGAAVLAYGFAIMYILGYDIALLFFGTVRELLTNGGFFGVSFLPLTVPTASTVFGGFIILALLSAGFRSVIRLTQKKAVAK